jgi:hypothetical protein
VSGQHFLVGKARSEGVKIGRLASKQFVLEAAIGIGSVNEQCTGKGLGFGLRTSNGGRPLTIRQYLTAQIVKARVFGHGCVVTN